MAQGMNGGFLFLGRNEAFTFDSYDSKAGAILMASKMAALRANKNEILEFQADGSQGAASDP
jgi:hypothetical protein